MKGFMIRFEAMETEWTTYVGGRSEVEALASARKQASEAIASGRAERATVYEPVAAFQVSTRNVEELEL